MQQEENNPFLIFIYHKEIARGAKKIFIVQKIMIRRVYFNIVREWLIKKLTIPPSTSSIIVHFLCLYCQHLFGLKNVFQKWLLLQEMYLILMGQKAKTKQKKRKTLIATKTEFSHEFSVFYFFFTIFTAVLHRAGAPKERLGPARESQGSGLESQGTIEII